MNEESSLIVVELAKEFIELVQGIEPKWTRGFYRFQYEIIRYGGNCSYSSSFETILIDPFDQNLVIKSMNNKALKIIELLEKERAVLLLIVDSDFNYEIKFEYENLDCWRITKLNRGTGIPI